MCIKKVIQCDAHGRRGPGKVEEVEKVETVGKEKEKTDELHFWKEIS